MDSKILVELHHVLDVTRCFLWIVFLVHRHGHLTDFHVVVGILWISVRILHLGAPRLAFAVLFSDMFALHVLRVGITSGWRSCVVVAVVIAATIIAATVVVASVVVTLTVIAVMTWLAAAGALAGHVVLLLSVIVRGLRVVT